MRKIFLVFLILICGESAAVPFSSKGFNWALGAEDAIVAIEKAGGKFRKIDKARNFTEPALASSETDKEIALEVDGWTIGGLHVSTVLLRSQRPYQMLGFDKPEEIDEALLRYKNNFGNPTSIRWKSSANGFGHKVRNFTAFWRFTDGSEIALIRAVRMDIGMVMFNSPQAVKQQESESRDSSKAKAADF